MNTVRYSRGVETDKVTPLEVCAAKYTASSIIELKVFMLQVTCLSASDPGR